MKGNLSGIIALDGKTVSTYRLIQ